MSIRRSRIPKTTKHPIINGVMTYPDGREVCVQTTVAGRREYKVRTRAMVMRQRGLDAITGEFLDTWAATFDHQSGRGSNSSHRDDRIEVDGEWRNAALSLASNTLKGSKRYEWRGGKYLPVERGKGGQA